MSNKEFTNQVRGVLIQRGTTLSAWARAEGLNVKTVFAAVYGQRNGRLSKHIRAKLRRITS
jgi:gp16 family phage-associated protein